MAAVRTAATAYGNIHPNQAANGNPTADTYVDADRRYAYAVTHNRDQYTHTHAYAIADNTHHYADTHIHQSAH